MNWEIECYDHGYINVEKQTMQKKKISLAAVLTNYQWLLLSLRGIYETQKRLAVNTVVWPKWWVNNRIGKEKMGQFVAWDLQR